MGISYSAVKVEQPEAWHIGKDYYGYTDLFPACAYAPTGIVARMLVPKLTDLPYLVGSRHMVGNAVFRVTDYYDSAEAMLVRIEELKRRKTDEATVAMLRAFYEWAGSDPIQLIADFDELDERDAADEYQLCVPPCEYRHVDGWNGEAGRKVGYEEEDYCSCAYGAQGAPVDADCPIHGLPEDEEE